MNCAKCGKNLEKSWNFCPNCGLRAPKVIKFSVNLNNVFKQFANMLSPPVKTKNQATLARSFEKTVEPETIKISDGPVKVYEISLPGVSSMDNIAINEFEESVEIKAFAGKILYFKAIKKSSENEVSEKILEKEKLVLTIS